ncbi:hypothetical protein BH23ACT2_BH23ACT2_17370 [soil metagenome]
MGFLDNVRSTIAKNADKADKAIDQAAEAADTRTGGKHRDKITKATMKAKELLDKVENDAATGDSGTTRPTTGSSSGAESGDPGSPPAPGVSPDPEASADPGATPGAERFPGPEASGPDQTDGPTPPTTPTRW